MNIKLDNENINVEDNKSIIELFGDKLNGNYHIIACDINNEIKTLNYIWMFGKRPYLCSVQTKTVE